VVPEAHLCPLCKKQMRHGHPFVCRKMTGNRTLRHNGIRDVVHQEAVQAHAGKVSFEPTVVDLGIAVRPTAPGQGTGKDRTDPYRARADVSLDLHAGSLPSPASTLVIDVVVTHPISEWSVKKSVAGKAPVAGAAAQVMVNAKEKSYGDRFIINNQLLYACSMESAGYMHRRFVSLVRLIAKLQHKHWSAATADPRTRPVYFAARFRRAIERISIALQRGNARLIIAYRRSCALAAKKAGTGGPAANSAQQG
jgi:hypothetical protein